MFIDIIAKYCCIGFEINTTSHSSCECQADCS